jgi:hypothetical protein
MIPSTRLRPSSMPVHANECYALRLVFAIMVVSGNRGSQTVPVFFPEDGKRLSVPDLCPNDIPIARDISSGLAFRPSPNLPHAHQ